MIAREIAIEATRLLIGYSVAISTLEMLATRELFAADGLLSWRVLRTGTYRLRGRAESIRDAMFGEGGMLAHLVLRMALALVLMLPVPGTIWGSCAFVLLASGLVLTYRSMFGGDGSDQMTTIVLAGIGYEAFAVPGIFADAGLWFIAGQLVVSYFAAGVAKLVSPRWRRGTATVDVLRSACYGSRSAVRILETIPGGSAAASWAVMSFEVAFPLALIAPPPVAIAFLVMGFAFHLGNAAFMGLNTFLTAFLPPIRRCCMSFARTAPLKPVMIYDGDCGVCEWFASWARRQVPMWRIVAAQRCSDAELTGLGITRDRCAEAVQVVAHGCVLSGAQAMNALLIAAHHPLGTVARIAAGCAPLLALENRAYRLFARHRATVSRFFGLRSCRIGS